MTQIANPAHGLSRVGTYRRSVPVSLERVWENVLDWEHLPWLHDSSFLDAQVLDAGDWGWRAKLGIPHAPEGRREIELELLIQEPGDRYVSRTTRGEGAGTEIWTRLAAKGAQCTDIEVEFWLPQIPPKRRDGIGAAFTALYTKLWDEDDQMMRHRQAQLDRSNAPAPTTRHGLDLGLLEQVRSRLPLDVEVDGRPFRVNEVAGELVAHSRVCPHRLGPLADPVPETGELRCPWHGYRFDPRTGASCEGRRMRLEAAPSVRIDPCSSRVSLVWS